MTLLRAILACLLLFCTPVRAAEVTVFAAASLKTALDAVAAAYAAETGERVVISYAGSSALARQIQLGAPADLFISANTAWMDMLEQGGQIASSTRVDLLGNRLALLAHGPSDPVEIAPGFDLMARLGQGRLAMALVEAVPAGIYGKQALRALGLWDAVAPQVAQTDNVRAALALVALGEAPLGITYRTDAQADPRVSVLGLFPEDSHDPIRYPAAALTGRDAAARPLLDFLQAPEAAAIFARNGFVVMTDG